MALVLKTAQTINALGTELYIEFVEATGVYDVDDNPGGFNTPNPARNQLAIILYAVHQKVDGDVAADVQGNNPLSVSSFTINITKAVNGVLYYNLFALPIFDDLAVYVDGDVVYDNENPTAPFIKERVAGEWVVRTAEELIGNENVDQLNAYAFTIPDAETLVRSLNAIKLKKLRDFIYDRCEKEDYEPARDKYEYVVGLLQSATNAFCALAYNEAQIDLEEIFAFEESLVENE